MRMVDKEGHALGRRYYCPDHDKILQDDELVRGYETPSGKMIVITDAEFESAAPEKSRDIQLERFVPIKEIAPAFFDRPYFLAPTERAGKAYALLAQTMAKTGSAGIGSFVMRGHEYLVAILADGGVLRAEVLRFGSELRTPDSIGLPKAPSAAKPKLVSAFAREIDGLAEKALDLNEMEDLEAAALSKFAKRKAKTGKGVIALDELDGEEEDGQSAAGADVIDLMAMLKRSLGARTATTRGSGGAATTRRKAPSAARTASATAVKKRKKS